MSKNPNPRDQAVASQAADRSLMCSASGCPNVWSVDVGNGRLCSAHAWVSSHHWPQVTQEQLDAETDRARYGQADRAVSHAEPTSHAEKINILAKLRSAFTEPKDPRGWIARLKARHYRGEKLNLNQIDALREVERKPARVAE